MPFKGAFQCAKCPQTANPTAKRACPAWWETRWTDGTTEREERACAFLQLPTFLNHVARKADSAATSSQEARNFADEARDETRRGFRAIALATNAGLEDVKAHAELIARDPEGIFGLVAYFRANSAAVHGGHGDDQQPRLRRDDRAPNGAANDGPVLLRHNPQQADLVEQYEFDLEGCNGH